jgi:L-threonylcarbamoyladenylate synthase
VSARIFSANEISTKKIVELILQGHLVAIPTETVYGLAANASDEKAIKKIFQLKNRPEDHPLIVHIASPLLGQSVESFWETKLSEWAHDVPPEAILLAKQHWPGPLTLVLKKAKQVSNMITGGQETIAIRAPKHPWTIEILRAFNGGLVAPSANRFGRISPTTAQHVLDEFQYSETHHELMILDGGSCDVGIESTILDLSRLDQTGPTILRPGMILESDICATLGLTKLGQKDNTIRHSGGILGHYAPRTQMVSMDIGQLRIEDISNQKVVVVTFLDIKTLRNQWASSSIDWIHIPLDPHAVAKQMYQLLRDLDQKGYQKIIIHELPSGIEWSGIQDRLSRAVYGSGVH